MRIGMLTGGGDCPGLNAVIRNGPDRGGRARRGGGRLPRRVARVLDERYEHLDVDRCRGILPRGGTILGTSRDQPYTRPDGPARVAEVVERLGLDAIVAIGGDGTMGVTKDLHRDGVPVVGVPKTIDNDIALTEMTFGFQTAVQICTFSIDRLHTTAESHDQVLVVEVMGRHVGHIAVWSGLAEAPPSRSCPRSPSTSTRCAAGSPPGTGGGAGPRSWSSPRRSAGPGHPRRGRAARRRLRPPAPRRHRQRGRRRDRGAHRHRDPHHDPRPRAAGGTPVAFDRVLATRFGVAAVDAVADRAFGEMVALRHGDIVRVPVAEAVGHQKVVDPALLRVARVFAPPLPDDESPPALAGLSGGSKLSAVTSARLPSSVGASIGLPSTSKRTDSSDGNARAVKTSWAKACFWARALTSPISLVRSIVAVRSATSTPSREVPGGTAVCRSSLPSGGGSSTRPSAWARVASPLTV
ncbi:MAG: 6-phosphofructokinase [Acidimicrobiales bacterium]